MITHRCNGNLKARVSIRYAYQWPYMLRSPSEKQAWRMITYGVGDEYMDTVIETSNTEINFCPFCGQKLEVANKRGQMSVRKMLDDIIWLTESEEKDEIDQMIDETLRRIDK